MFDLEQELKNLPEDPGVYIMHDKDDKIIYVGKAKILKNRVRQYKRQTENYLTKMCLGFVGRPSQRPCLTKYYRISTMAIFRAMTQDSALPFRA